MSLRPPALLAAAAASLALASPAAGARSQLGQLVPGSGRAVPPLAGIDPVTGKRVSLAQWRGRPLLLNLWGSWCSPCRREARELARFLARHPRSLLGIDVEDSKAGARSFARRYGTRFPSIFDPRDRLVHRLQATGTPTTLFLDRRHRVVAVLYGPGTLALFERGYRLATRSPSSR
ncbi:MAG TPA: TlpA disulfide reductase family protein [Gaiellaceae bacterium]|nr:TlpA disulfide reductase family protein [Gaiellaceae bacterium]